MAHVLLICLATIMPASARIPFEISGYIHMPDGSACLDPIATITNLDMGTVLPVITLPSSNYYQTKSAPLLNEISENDVLEFRVSAGTDSVVIGHRITTSDLNSGGLDFNITLSTVKIAVENEVGDPSLPQVSATSTPASTSSSAPSWETQIPGFKIVSASVAMIACMMRTRKFSFRSN